MNKQNDSRASSAELATTLGVSFNDLDLLTLALTHRSYLNEHDDATEDNERLEFLGDAVLDFIVGSYLFRRFPSYQEGELTALRAALVRAETLAQFSKQLSIDKHLRLGYGEAESGGRNKIPTLCATFEAVIGAIYLDQGIEATIPLIETLAAPMLVTIQEQQLHKDAKSEFQVWAQAEFGITPRYQVVAENGPDHAKEFTVEAIVGKTIWGTGKGRSKRRAAQTAASEALTRAIHGDDAVEQRQDAA
ncbi:MAG: ribonuclease III [Candidatus Promineifilaceae bacterium]